MGIATQQLKLPEPDLGAKAGNIYVTFFQFIFFSEGGKCKVPKIGCWLDRGRWIGM